MDLKLDMDNDLDTVESLKKFRGISYIFYVFMTSINVRFLRHFAVFGYNKCPVETLDFHIEYVFDRIYHSAKFIV